MILMTESVKLESLVVVIISKDCVLLMEKKLFEINEAFEHLRFSDCLATIDQLVKKYSKPDKKKQTLSERELTVVKCFRAGALVSLGRYHEAHTAYCTLIAIQRKLQPPTVWPLSARITPTF